MSSKDQYPISGHHCSLFSSLLLTTKLVQGGVNASLSAGLSDSSRKALAWWLGGTSAWVFSMVVLGGLTRLTRSGLSMTDWKFSGERPPSTLVSLER